MSELTTKGALNEALKRWASSPRRGRSDRGKARLRREVENEIGQLLSTRERPTISKLHEQLGAFCRKHGYPIPARGSVYNAMDRAAVRHLAWNELPAAVRESLYNLRDTNESAESSSETQARRIPADQVVFCAFNYGSPRAVSFASGLPWLSLYRASKRRGWRPKSRALLEAVLEYRNIR